MRTLTLIIGMFISLSMFGQDHEQDYKNGKISYHEYMFACSGTDFYKTTRKDSIIIPFYENRIAFPFRMKSDEISQFCDFEIIKKDSKSIYLHKNIIINEEPVETYMQLIFIKDELESIKFLFEGTTNAIEYQNQYNKISDYLIQKLGNSNEINYHPQELKTYNTKDKFNHLFKYEFSTIETFWYHPDLTYKLSCGKSKEQNISINILVFYKSQANRNKYNKI